MNTRQIEVARGNHAFYYIVVPMNMFGQLFAEAFLNSLSGEGQPVLFPIEHHEFSGYIEIDTADIKRNCSHGGMADDVHSGLLGKVAHKMPRRFEGEMNTDVVIVHDIYKFCFKIAKYERDRDHEYEPIDDPSLTGYGEQLGRFAKLAVTIALPEERQS